MTELTTVDLADADAVARRRDEIVAAVRDHAGRIADALARLHGDDDGRRAFTTDADEWTVAYEAGDLQYLRFSPRSGSEIYPVSTKRPPEPGALTTAMADYGAFVAAYDTACGRSTGAWTASRRTSRPSRRPMEWSGSVTAPWHGSGRSRT